MDRNIGNTLTVTLNDALYTVVTFLPRFLSGLIVLLIGVILGAFLKQVIIQLFGYLKLGNILKRYGVPESKGGADWALILGELVRWFVILLFFVPVAEMWGLSGFTRILNNLLLFLPNVFIAVIFLMVGFVVAKLVHDLVRASMQGISPDSAKTVARVARWAVIVFVSLVVLNQLGIASDLIRILFSGVVAMVAVAGGLAFGLGGKDVARELLESLRKKM